MLKIFGDFETYYSSEYSLRKMTPIEYIKSSQFEAICCAVAVNDKDPVCFEGDRAVSLFRKINEPFMFVSHNALFDACILAYRYEIFPTLCVDTLGMSRALLGPYLSNGRASLDSVANHLHLPAKGKEVVTALGKSLQWFKENQTSFEAYKSYCKHDTWLCREIYRKLSPQFPANEHIINDMIVRMTTIPQFTVNYDKLLEHKAMIVGQKLVMLAAIEANNTTKDDLMSNEKLAQQLKGLGVDPPTKISAATGKTAWAFSKADTAFLDLQEHENPMVQNVIAARIGLKSTLEETRTQRFINVATVTYDGKDSWMPIPLAYGAAHTHRFGGDWRMNMQNLPSRKVKTLRESLTAPEGFQVVTVDASQIEARLTAWLAGEDTLISRFAAGADVYSEFASEVYGYLVTKANKIERFLGKTSILGLGFGMGKDKFHRTVQISAADQNITIELSLEEAERVVRLYRSKYRKIAKSWYFLNDMIPQMYRGTADGSVFGPCKFEGSTILLPNGMRLVYNDLQYKHERWTYAFGRERRDIYGGKVLENIVQALDRVYVMDAAVRVRRKSKKVLGYGLQLAHQVHDELVYIVPDALVGETKAFLVEEMRARPDWGLDLPLDAEAGHGPNFAEAK